jgi:hypothetical protein
MTTNYRRLLHRSRLSYLDSWPFLLAGLMTLVLAVYVYYRPKVLPTVVHDPRTGACVSIVNPKGRYWDCTSIPPDMPAHHIFDDSQPQT